MKNTPAADLDKRNSQLSSRGSDQFKMSPEDVEIREVAMSVVQDILQQAIVAAGSPEKKKVATSIETPDNLNLSGAPTIQIDLVGSRTPSPEEEFIEMPKREARKKRKKKEPVKGGSVDEEDELKEEVKPEEKLDNDSLREFVVGYINEVVTKAVPIAEERLLTKIDQMEIDEISSKITSGSWYSRIRESVTRFLQTMCVCGERRDSLS